MEIEFPELTISKQKDQPDMEKTLEEINQNPSTHNSKIYNKDRHGVGEFFGI